MWNEGEFFSWWARSKVIEKTVSDVKMVYKIKKSDSSIRALREEWDRDVWYYQIGFYIKCDSNTIVKYLEQEITIFSW